MALTATRKQSITCTDEEIKTFYANVHKRLNGIKLTIQMNEQNFEKYPIANHPVTNTVALAILETRTQPANCPTLQVHAREIQIRLNEYKALIGTAFCKKASQAYDLLAEHVTRPTLARIKKDMPTASEIIFQYSQLYEQLIIAYNKARQQNK